MSEYQYYEFQAIDRPLSDGDMRNLRAFSTRARITRTSFVNEYQWGSFKGDEDAWMAKYFDAFLYYANWNTRIIKLRVPGGVIAAATARRYCRPGALDLQKTATHLIFTFASDDDSGADDEVPEATLSSFVALRQEGQDHHGNPERQGFNRGHSPPRAVPQVRAALSGLSRTAGDTFTKNWRASQGC